MLSFRDLHRKKGERVLSIQSHVVRGYVGNKSAVFPLQLLGFDVDAIHSVHYSNHSGRRTFRGPVLSPQDLWDVVLGMEENRLIDDTYKCFLTGYIATGSLLSTIGSIVDRFKSYSPSMKYVCDPVLGDGGVFYVEPSMVDLFRDVLIPKADIVTPNHFEAEKLWGKPIERLSDAWEACDYLHSLGVPMVIITSLDIERRVEYDEAGRVTNTWVKLLFSEKREDEDCCMLRYEVEFPKIEGEFTGVGDLFAALIFAHMHLSGARNRASALVKTIYTIHMIIENTAEMGEDELRLIQNADVILQARDDVPWIHLRMVAGGD